MATNRNKVGTSTDSLMSSSPFLGGLNTELSGIVDSTDFTKDECNMMIRADGSRSRRPGVDYEELFKFNNELIDTSVPNLAFNCIEWTDINSPDESQTYEQIPYIVVQIGSKIIFYKNKGQPYSAEEIDWVLDLLEESSPGVYKYKLNGRSERDVATARCKFTTAYGCLFITSEAIKPIRLRGAQDETLPYIGETYPYCNVSCSAYRTGLHSSLFSGFMCSIPSVGKVAYYEFYLNNILLGHFDVNTFSRFPNSYTLAQSFNSIDANVRRNITATPKENAPDTWTSPAADNGYTPEDYITFRASSSSEAGLELKIVVVGYVTMMPVDTSNSKYYYPVGNEYTATLARGSSIFTNSVGLNLQIRDTTKGAEDYLAVDTNPAIISYAHLYNLLNQGWTLKLITDFYKNSDAGSNKFFPGNNLAQQYLKDTKTDPFKPQDLINMTFGNTPAARGHIKLDFFNQDRNTAGSLETSMSALATLFKNEGLVSSEAEFFTNLRDALGQTGTEAQIAAAQVPVVKPRKDYVVDICTYAGRIFYLCGDVLLYSQMISEDVTKSDQCYTSADPTSEELSDVVETDGGLISLPDIGEGIKLAQFGQYLFVFGTRGNALITGTANNIFTATAYSAGSLNSVPTQAPYSFVNTEYGIFYWGTSGIEVIGAGEGGLAVQDISSDKILTWFGKLSNVQHKWCKGVYSSSKKKIYWFYPSDEEQPRRLDNCLVYDIQKGAFAPQKIATGYTNEDSGEYVEGGLPEIVSGLPLKVPFKSVKEYPIVTVPTEDDPNAYEITIDSQTEGISNFNGYRDASQAADKETVSIPLTTYPGNYSRGAVIRIDLSYFSGMTEGESREIMRFRSDYDWSTIMTVNLTKSSTHYSIDYSGFAVLIPFDGDEVFWFVIANDWRSSPYKTYMGCVPEGSVISTGYTAETVPNTIISYCRNRYISGYTGDSIICEFNSAACGDLSDYTAFVTVDNATNSFTDRREAFTSDQAYYYVKSGEDAVYTLQGDEMVPFGTVRNTYTNYIDCVKTDGGFPTYRVFKYNGVNYYTRENLLAEHPAFFTRVDGALQLWGFGTDIATTSTAEITSLDGLTTVTATYDPYALSFLDPYIVVLERYPSIDTYKKYIISGDNYKVLADDPIDSEEFTYESSALVCLDVANQKITFGDFRNNLLKDWTAGDWNGDGYIFDSYLISHPMNSTSTSQFTGRRITDLTHSKNMPYLITYFRRTETGETTEGDYIYPSACQGSILWDWRTSGAQGKWSSPTDLYRPYKKTIFDNGYVINKTNIRGLGRAYQVKLESVEGSQFILEGLVYDLKNDGRI